MDDYRCRGDVGGVFLEQKGEGEKGEVIGIQIKGDVS